MTIRTLQTTLRALFILIFIITLNWIIALRNVQLTTQATAYPALTAMGRTGRKWRPLKEKAGADEWPDGWGDGMEDLGQYSSCGIRVTHLLTSEGRQ